MGEWFFLSNNSRQRQLLTIKIRKGTRKSLVTRRLAREIKVNESFILSESSLQFFEVFLISWHLPIHLMELQLLELLMY